MTPEELEAVCARDVAAGEAGGVFFEDDYTQAVTDRHALILALLEHDRPGRPDRDRVERAAVDLLSAWFNAHAMLPEQSPRLIGSRDALRRALDLALELCTAVDALELPLPVAERMLTLNAGLIESQRQAQAVAQATSEQFLRTLRESAGGVPPRSDG